MNDPLHTPAQQATSIEKKIRRRTVFSFAVFVGLFIAGWFAWQWLYHSPGAANDTNIHKPLRKILQGNERIFSTTFNENRLVKTFPKAAAAKQVRVNGSLGLGGGVDTVTWRLKVVCAPGDTMKLSLDELRQLPKTEIIFDFKCIEGWDQVSHWGGVKFSDFIAHYQLHRQKTNKYIGLVTPDGQYYVGIDMPSALQQQTLLCYEMNGQPLPMNQGYPLRLIIPVKYGIKHLKRIGMLFFSDTPPRDYWAERGYDYYSGL